MLFPVGPSVWMYIARESINLVFWATSILSLISVSSLFVYSLSFIYTYKETLDAYRR